MLSFLYAVPFHARLELCSSLRTRPCRQRRGVAPYLLSTARVNPPCMALETDKPLSAGLGSGIEAALQDFVKSGMNICVGGSNASGSVHLVGALAKMMDAEGLADMAFVSTCARTRTLLAERDMPSDLSVNFKKGLDLFITVVAAMDANCNAVLDVDDIASEAYAAQSAEKVVIIISDNDAERCNAGLPSIPVQMVGFLPDVATESLCAPALFDRGVRGATLRQDGSHIADISLAPNTLPFVLREELRALPQVQGVGLLVSTANTTAVVATKDEQPFDLTSPLHTMAVLDNEARSKILGKEEREKALKRIGSDWNVVAQHGSSLLCKEFVFADVKGAEAFLRYVQYAGREARHYPQVKQNCMNVGVQVPADGAQGITQMDLLLSKELSLAYQRVLLPSTRRSAVF